jgi:diguanylate cyclase (GGDEF)-like protein
MKKYTLLLIIVLYSGLSLGSNIVELENTIKSTESPQQQLVILKKHEAIYLDSTVPTINRYWLLLGLAFEQNNQLDKAFSILNKSLENLTPLKNKFREIYLQTLLQRSYITYLKTYDAKRYCPDRKEAYDMVNDSISIDLQVRVYVQYAFCFQQDKSKFSFGLSLLDKALMLAKQHKLPANTHGMIYNASGLIYQKNQMPDKAYNYLLQAYQQWETVNDYQDMFNMLHSLTHTAVSMLDFESANKHIAQMFTLAHEQPAFKDFNFFSYFNAGLVAQAEGDFSQSNENFTMALKEQRNTNEVYFVKLTFEQLISNYFRLNNIEQATAYLSLLQTSYPEHKIQLSNVNAFVYYKNQQYMPAVQTLIKKIDNEINERRLFVKHAAQATSLLNSQSIIELDKKILEKTIKIQELNLAKEQTEKRSIYLLLIIAFIFFIGLSIFSYYLFKTRKFFKFHARIDYLTGVYNRRYLFEKGDKTLTKFSATNQNVALFLIDIDNFKKINDTNGHSAGDVAIKFVVEQCKKTLSNKAIIGRLGGDEFLVILPGYTLEKAKNVAEKIRVQVCNSNIKEIKPLPLSLSIGVVLCNHFTNLEEAIADADRLLYLAKERGRNIVVD